MADKWRVESTSGPESLQRVLNELDKDLYRVQNILLVHQDSGQVYVVARRDG
jgi:hypothetical protein